jgi:hypothetical protein
VRSGLGHDAWQVVEHLKLATLLLPWQQLPATASGYRTPNVAVFAEDLIATITGEWINTSRLTTAIPASCPPFCYNCKRVAPAFCPICEHCQHDAALSPQYFYQASWASTLFHRCLTPLHHSRQRSLAAAVLAAHSRNSRWAKAQALAVPLPTLPPRPLTKAIVPLSRTSIPPAIPSSNDSLLALARLRLISLKQQ